MGLVNIPTFRIRKYPRGYVVEVEYKRWLGKSRWKHIISVAGMRDMPWYFSTREMAVEEATRLFKQTLNI